MFENLVHSYTRITFEVDFDKWAKKVLVMDFKKLLGDHFKTVLKLILFIILLLIFCYFYLVSEVDNFMKKSTTFSNKYVQSEMIQEPNLLICMKPGLKRSKAKYYNFTLEESLIFTKEDRHFIKNNMTLWQVYEDMSYKHSEDFFIEATNAATLGKIKSIQSIATYFHGLCHLITMDHEIHFSSYWNSKISFNISLNNGDIPDKIDIFLTSNNSWQGIVMNEWPYKDYLYLQPLTIDFNTSYQYEIGVIEKELHFLKNDHIGHDKCFIDAFQRINCTKKCFPIVFNFIPEIRSLPPCHSYEEIHCYINGFWDYKKLDFVKCLKPKNVLLYDFHFGKTLVSKPQEKAINLLFYGASPLKKVEEEVLVISPTSFIGSIGGSLGLFFGFSFLACFSSLFDKCKLPNQN